MSIRIPVVLIVAGLASLYPLQRWIDRSSARQAASQNTSDNTLYFASGRTIKQMSLGLDGLVADIYWMRSIQYFGRQSLEARAAGAPGIKLDLLPQLLNITVDIDPHHIPAYRFGAIFLPDISPEAAIALLEKGIRNNPTEWRLYQDLGYIYWHMGDFADAAKVYEAGSQQPGASWWMHDLAGFMKIKGGSRDTARAIYSTYLTSDDKNIRAEAVFRLKMLRSLDEIDFINGLLTRYKSETGHCPPNLKVFARLLQAQEIGLDDDLNPVDPDGVPYVFDQTNCKISISPRSHLPATF